MQRMVTLWRLLIPMAVFGSICIGASSKLHPDLHPYYLNYDTLSLEKPYLPKDNPLTVEGVKLGRYLFYDPILSGNNQQSCGSCHQQQYNFSDGKPRAIGYKGDTLERNSMSLLNLAWSKEYFWDGRVNSLETLVSIPMTNPKEMGQDSIELIKELKAHASYPTMFEEAFGTREITMRLVSKAIAQFLRTIITNGVQLPSRLENDLKTKSINAQTHALALKEESLTGMFLRFAQMCSRCHNSEIYGGRVLMDNGVNDGRTPMKVPSLINITKTAPYMHDGRFKTLSEVLHHYEAHIETLGIRDSVVPKVTNLLLPYDVAHADEFFTMFEEQNILKNSELSDPFQSNKQ